MARMTSAEIDAAIDGALEDIAVVFEVTREPRIIRNALRGALRGCFVAGQDDGQQIILERADSIDSSSASMARQAGNATLEIMAWVSAVPGRSFTGVAELPGLSGGRFVAGIMRSESDKEGSGDAFWSEYCYGESFVDALVKMAQWCREQSAKRDTLPAPALAPTSDGAIVAAEVVP